MSDARPVRRYGTWPSPLGAPAVASGRIRLGDMQLDGDDVYWIEGRPAERGRCVIVRHRDGETSDVLAPPFSARTWVHEYGGGALRASGGEVFFSNAADKRIYTLASGEPSPLTPELGDVRYADIEIDRQRSRLVCIVEDHRGAAVANDIRALPLSGGEPVSLVSGNDFYAAPRISPDGTRMCWLTWNQPNMPWDGTELWVAELDDAGMPRDARCVAGGERESVFQPAWSPGGVLHFVSDPTGWWNLYRLERDAVVPLAPMDAECGQPAWVFRLSTYAFLGDERVALCACRDGLWSVGTVDGAGAYSTFELPYNDVDGCIDAHGNTIAFVAGGPHTPHGVVLLDAHSGEHRMLVSANELEVDESIISEARPVTFPGWEGGEAHGFLYEPRNDAVQPEPGERPPLYVHAHGGPTSACAPVLDPLVQYWTSRGFAYLDVNYGGSTGYGRAYRDRLLGQQGVVDVGDCINGARHLAETGVVDPQRLVIEGGSAGGYIVLCAMTFHDVFAAGISLYGISDLELLLTDTHKFEARYFDGMVGPYPELRDIYRERSPIHHITNVKRAVFLLQGLDDPIVPPNQAEIMFAALREGDVPSAYIGFPGEQHGFRQAANIVRTLESELYFLGRVLGFEPADSVEPVDIVNLERAAT